MFRARRMMELDAMIAEIEAEQRAATQQAAIQAAIESADEEATTVLNIADVLEKLDVGRLDQDRTGVQVLGAGEGGRRDIVLICPGDPDEEVSRLVRGPWFARQQTRADEEISEIIRGPWTEPVERQPLAPDELEAAILEADEESSEIIAGPWLADEEATCVYNQEELEALLRRS